MSLNGGKNKNKGFANAKLQRKLPQPRTFFQLNCNGLFEHPRFCRNSRYDFTNPNQTITRRSGECECCPPDSYYEAELKKVFEYVRKNQFHLCYFSETWVYGEDGKGTEPVTEHPLSGPGGAQNGGREEETWLHKYGLSETYRAYFSLQHRNYFGSRDTAWAGNVVFVHKDVQPPVKILRHADIGLTQGNAQYQGRYLEFEFPDGFHVLTTYMPFSGFNDNRSRTKKKIALRKTLDLAVRERLVQLREKEFVWMGDLNVSPGPLDHFLGEPGREDEYAMSMQEKQDGTHIEDIDDRGECGYTPNLKKRFHETVRLADGVDAFRHLSPYTRIYTQPHPAPGITRWDHYIVSKKIIEENRLEECEIYPDKCFSSDHCVVTMKLRSASEAATNSSKKKKVFEENDDDSKNSKNMSMLEQLRATSIDMQQLRAKRLKRFANQ